MLRIIFLILFCFTISFCLGQAQSELNETSVSYYHKAEKELNSVYQQILKEYKADTVFIKNLKIAQRLWLQLRHAEMQVKFPDGLTYGSIFPMCWTGYLTDLTKKRTLELKVWLDGTEDGDACAGSVKIKN